MSIIVVILALAATGLLLAWHRARLVVWTAAIGGVLLLASTLAGGLAWVVLLPAWVGWLLLAAANHDGLRRQYLTAPLFSLMRDALPRVSDTEREALEAGTVWWDAELFSGRPDWRRLLELPVPPLSAEEQAFLDGPVETLCDMLDDWQVSHQLRDLPSEVWEFIRDQGFWGLIIPKEYGGKGFSAAAHSAVVAKIASRCGTAAVTVMVPNSLGPGELLVRYGTDEQRDYWLPRLARGEEVPCFALTNPQAGSDAAAIPDAGIVCRGIHDGEEVLGLRVSWEKRYITLAPVATVLGLAFRVRDPEHLLGDAEDLGITLALIPTDHPGVEIGRRHYPAHQAFQNGPTSGRDVFIPLSWVIGGPERIGQGWRMLMNCLAAGRAISLPSLSAASLQLALRTTSAYARVRRQFRLPIGRFEGVAERLAAIAADAFAVDSARVLTARAVDAGEEPAVVSALLKYQATERMRAGINDAMDIHGGRAVCVGPSNYLWSAYEALPVAITVEGANILTRTLIVFGQGAIRCHPTLQAEIHALEDPIPERGLEAFDGALRAHVARIAEVTARSLVHGLAGGRLGCAPGPSAAQRWYGLLERWSAALAFLSEVALVTLGGGLKRREALSGRFADVLGDLYLASAALRRYRDEGETLALGPVVDLACARAVDRIAQSLAAIIDELPGRALRVAVRAVVFPLGRPHRLARDRLALAVAETLLEPGELRDALTAAIHLPRGEHEPVARLERALALVVDAEPLERTLHEAQASGALEVPAGGDELAAALAAGVLGEPEVARLRAAREAVAEVIAVDAFTAAELATPGLGPALARAS